MNESIKLVFIGIGIGILSGLLGVGGGVFLVPILVTYLGVSQHHAQGTSLAVIVPTAIVSSLSYGFHGNIDLGLALNLIVGSILGVSIGARIMKKLPAAKLKQLFGGILIIVGLRMVLG